MKTFRILLTDLPWGDARIEREILEPLPAEVIEAPDGREDTLTSLARGVDAIATCWATVTEKVIRAAPECRIVSRMGIGLDNIDVEFATAQRIPVTNVPDYCVEEVADHALALLLSIARNVAFFHLRTKSGEYDLQAGPLMRRLSTQTIGLFGLGRTGQAVATRAKSFGMRVMAHTKSGDDHGTGCRMVDFDTLLRESDYISLHAPATPETRHTFDEQALAAMKPRAVLINTSRGALIDPAALRQAMEQGRLAGAGLDVFDPEPPDLSQALYRNERVVLTPHAAFVSDEALIDLRNRVGRQIADALTGKRPENVVNAAALGEG